MLAGTKNVSFELIKYGIFTPVKKALFKIETFEININFFKIITWWVTQMYNAFAPCTHVLSKRNRFD